MNTENWTKQLDQITRDFKDTFGTLTEDQMNWKPDEKTWSIAQNLQHLIVLNESYFPALDSLRKGTYQTSFLSKLTAGLFGKILLKSVQPDRKKKVKTFPLWKPSESNFTGIMNQFEEHQEAMKQQIEKSEKLLEQGAIISSPANKNIAYKLETAFDIIVAHEKRHFEQAKEVLGEMP